MNKKEKEKLKRLIRRHVRAQVDLAFKGTAHPDDWEAIEDEASEASKKLFDFIKGIEE